MLVFVLLLYLGRAEIVPNRDNGHGIISSLEDIQDVTLVHAPYMAGCCEEVEFHEQGEVPWSLLLQCTNASSLRQQQNVARVKSNQVGASIGLVTYATKDIWNYTAYSFAVNEIYAEHNNYIMLHLDERSSDNYDPFDSRWNKVKILEEAIDPGDGWARHLDWVVWMDADAVVLDMDLRIEEVVAPYPEAHLLVSAEHAGSSTLINSGVVIAKNTAWCRDFLREWWTFKSRSLYSDQEQFDLLYKARFAELGLAEKVVILPPDAINSDPPAMTMQKPYNQVLHLMGEHTMYRVRVFESGLRELCSHISMVLGPSSVPVRRQLGLHRSNLLAWTIEEYGAESAMLLDEYRAKAATGDNGRRESIAMSNSVHHYAHALGSSHPEAQAMRKEVYSLLQLNLQQRRPRNIEHMEATGKVLDEWPEHLKCLAEAGQHLVHIGSTAERHQISMEVSSVLEEILQVCHKEQRRAVLLMVAHMDFEVGVIHMSAGTHEAGVHSFERGVLRHRTLAVDLGEHILVTPLAALATALCAVQRFEEASPLYYEAITIAERVFGSNHSSLAQHLLNFGISRVQYGRYVQAQDLLEKSLAIMRSNGVQSDDDMMQKCVSYLDMANNEYGATFDVEVSSKADELRLVHRRRKKAGEESFTGEP